MSDAQPILIHLINDLLAGCKLRDMELVNYCRSRMKDLAPSNNGSLFLPLLQEIVDYIIEADGEGEVEEKSGRMLALQCLKDIFGFESSLLADFYIMLATTLTNLGRITEAIEFCGRALLIRIRSHGLISEKTAESHFQLGSLYLRKGNSELARQEILAAMGVYNKIYSDDCLQITDCNILQGNIELREAKPQSAYLYLYRAYRTRYLTLGHDHTLTVAALQIVTQCRTTLNNDCYTVVELKDRVQELQWSTLDSKSFFHILAVYLTHLDDDLVLTTTSLQEIYYKTVRFYQEKLRANSVSLHDNNEEEAAPPSQPSESEALFPLQLPTMEEVVSLLRIRAPIATSNSVSVSVISPVKKVTPSLRSNSTGSSDKSSNSNNNLMVRAEAAPVAAADEESKDTTLVQQVQEEKGNEATITIEEKERTFADRARHLSSSNNNNDHDNSSSMNDDCFSQSLPLPSSSSKNSNSKPKNWKTIPIDSPLRRGGKSSIRTVTIPNLPVTPTKPQQSQQQSPLCVVRDDHGDLLLVQHCTIDMLRRKLRARFVAFGLLAWIGHSYHSNLLTAADQQEMTEETVHQSELEKWINRLKPPPPRPSTAVVSNAASKSLVLSIPSSSSSSSSVAATDATTGGSGTKGRRVSLIQQQLAATKRASIIAFHDPDHDDEDVADGSKGKAKNALNALFGNRANATAAGNAAAAADSTSTAGKHSSEGDSIGRRGDEARDKPTHKLPMPPPIPTHWPPVPYDPTHHDPDKIVSDNSGEGVKSAVVDTRPKLKQIHLTSLTSIEGTFWSEDFRSTDSSSLFKTEVLFADLEDEFVIGGVKKPAMHGNNAGKSPVAGMMNAVLAGITPRANHAMIADTALDAQRAQNINIMLAKFGKRSLDALAETIINFEPTVAGTAAITSLQQFIPNADEIHKVKLFVEKKLSAKAVPASKSDSEDRGGGGGSDTPLSLPPPSRDASIMSGTGLTLPPPPSSPSPGKTAKPAVDDLDGKALIDLKIGRAEQYIFIMGRIPHLETRLSAMSQALSAQELMQFVVSSSDILINAVSEVKGSGRLKFILKAMLELNNALLRQSKGTASSSNTMPMTGFALSAWSKAMQVKTNSGDTAQQYLVTKLLQHFPESLELARDLPSIDEAKSVLLARMTANVKKLEETVKLLSDLLAQETAKEASSKAVANLQIALTDVQRLYSEAKSRYDEAYTDFVQLCLHFGETCPPSDPESFFGEIAALTRALTAATTQASSKNRRKAMAAVGGGHGHSGGGHH